MTKENTIVILDQASGYLQIDMLEAYASKYTERAIIAGSIVERGTQLHKDVVWHKIVKYNRATLFKRVYTWFIGTFQMLYLVLTKYRNAHIVAITNPPFSIFVPWFLNCSYDIIIYDLYPDALVQYNYIGKKSIVYKIWKSLNKKAFRNAKNIFTLTDGMKSAASEYLDSKTSIRVVPLWSDGGDFTFIPKAENLILKRTNAHGKFVLLYSGNLGMTHPVEKIVEIGSRLDPNLYTVIIIGEGAKKKVIKEMLEKGNYPHIYLLPWQPANLLSHNLYAADISVVTLDKEASNLSIPSKTFNIMTVGNPILAICEGKSALGELIKERECGFVTDGHDISKAVRFIQQVRESASLHATLSKNSQMAGESFTKQNAYLYL